MGPHFAPPDFYTFYQLYTVEFRYHYHNLETPGQHHRKT
jgi:hypothetical protein